MKPIHNTIVLILIIITLVLASSLIVINKLEVKKEFSGNDAAIDMQSFEVSEDKDRYYEPTKKNTQRYDDKLFAYLEHIQGQRDKTFMRGRVFLKET